MIYWEAAFKRNARTETEPKAEPKIPPSKVRQIETPEILKNRVEK